MSNSGGSSGEGAERRGRVRLPVERQVEISWGEERREVVLEDLSLSGARMRLADPPAVGTRLAVGVGDQRIEASVVRVSGDSVGIRFDNDEAALGYVIGTVLTRPKDD